MGKRANGEGTITKRSDGSWQAATYVTTTAGRRVRKFVYGKTREIVRKKLVALQRSTDQGIPVADKVWKLGEYLTYWLEQVVRPQRRIKTYVGYEGVTRLYIVPGLGSKRVDKLSAQDIRVFLSECRAICLCCKYERDCKSCRSSVPSECCKDTLSPRMVQLIHAVLRNALQNAVREEIIPRNVAQLVTVQAPQYEVGKGLSRSQVRDLLATVQKDRFQAVYALALLGLRKGEILALPWSAVDLKAGVLRVEQTLQRVAGELRINVPKTKRSKRVVPLPEFCVTALERRREIQAEERAEAGSEWEETGLIFTTSSGKPVDPRNLLRQFYTVRERAGLDGYRFHDIRHTAVSLLLDLGVPPHVVREIVGHSAIEVTMDVYAHASLEEKTKALKRLGKEIA
ncbi:tyrosine-type recombinase/integrase [Sphaerisporangium dianthi]|uniref:Tyrosine-type recombinase/integrase n=1 Tax=Sphaerisporangium dianthi TaxID=1436120 RepID=A0ABV9CKQ4_9ACTN